MWAALIGFGLLGAALHGRSSELKQKADLSSDGQVMNTRESVQSVFSDPHQMYANGSEKLRIFGGGYPNIHAQGNPDDRNPINSIMIYPNSRDSSHINKNNRYWMKTGLFNKERQAELIAERFNLDDHRLLWEDYKQTSGRTQNGWKKINLKYI